MKARGNTAILRISNRQPVVDSKTDINENGVQIIENLSRIWVQTNHLFLISQNIHTDLKGPKIKYKLHYGWCTGRCFMAATLAYLLILYTGFTVFDYHQFMSSIWLKYCLKEHCFRNHHGPWYIIITLVCKVVSLALTLSISVKLQPQSDGPIGKF